MSVTNYITSEDLPLFLTWARRGGIEITTRRDRRWTRYTIRIDGVQLPMIYNRAHDVYTLDNHGRHLVRRWREYRFGRSEA